MKTAHVDIKMPDGICDSFTAEPGDTAQHPAVILLMDAFGLREYIFEMAKTLASKGYYVLAPNLFYRVKRSPVIDLKFPLKPEDMPAATAQLKPLFTDYKAEMGINDAKSWLSFLTEQKSVRPGPIGLTGYCMGGRLAVLIAENYPNQIAAAASFHAGGLVTDAPDSPHLQVGKIRALTYFGHADGDAHMGPEQIAKLEKSLKDAHVKFESEVYAGAKHGYTQKDLPMYNAEALERHWKKLPELLERAFARSN